MIEISSEEHLLNIVAVPWSRWRSSGWQTCDTCLAD